MTLHDAARRCTPLHASARYVAPSLRSRAPRAVGSAPRWKRRSRPRPCPPRPLPRPQPRPPATAATGHRGAPSSLSPSPDLTLCTASSSETLPRNPRTTSPLARGGGSSSERARRGLGACAGGAQEWTCRSKTTSPSSWRCGQQARRRALGASRRTRRRGSAGRALALLRSGEYLARGRAARQQGVRGGGRGAEQPSARCARLASFARTRG